ncbi:MAG TPA: GNAT family N-acetyltransferase [Vicinamibacteria bacterium]|nr:GNAT family N-acetyltransferase [Vicinamibacteria bacterium]
MSSTVIESSPSALMHAMEDNLLGHVAFLQRRLEGMTVEERGGLVIVDSGLANDSFNKVLHSRLAEHDADERIAEALGYFRDVGRPFSWWVGPCSRPLDLESRLQDHGLGAAEYELGMTIPLTEVPDHLDTPAGASIRRVATSKELSSFAAVLAELSDPADENVRAFFESSKSVVLTDDCPMRFYLAYVDSEPAAVSELFHGNGIAGVHMVGTSAKFRRRGLGMALTWTALADGKRLGMNTGTLQASPEGQPVYERLGFRPCGRFVEYTRRAVS